MNNNVFLRKWIYHNHGGDATNTLVVAQSNEVYSISAKWKTHSVAKSGDMCAHSVSKLPIFLKISVSSAMCGIGQPPDDISNCMCWRKSRKFLSYYFNLGLKSDFAHKPRQDAPNGSSFDSMSLLRYSHSRHKLTEWPLFYLPNRICRDTMYKTPWKINYHSRVVTTHAMGDWQRILVCTTYSSGVWGWHIGV